jgi:hypothetical protein
MGDHARATELLAQIEPIMHVEMSRYRHVLCGKLALQHGLAAYHTGRYQDMLRLLTIALARAILFAPKHRDRAAFELIITQVLAGTPADELHQFHQAIQDERVYIAASELPYQRPAPAEWAEAWDTSLRFIDETIEQTQLRVALTT